MSYNSCSRILRSYSQGLGGGGKHRIFKNINNIHLARLELNESAFLYQRLSSSLTIFPDLVMSRRTIRGTPTSTAVSVSGGMAIWKLFIMSNVSATFMLTVYRVILVRWKFRLYLRMIKIRQIKKRQFYQLQNLKLFEIELHHRKIPSYFCTGGSLAMILGTDVRLESPNPTPFIYQAKWKTWPIHILPISKIDPIHILFLKIDPIHILFFKFYPFIYFLGEKRYPIDILLM